MLSFKPRSQPCRPTSPCCWLQQGAGADRAGGLIEVQLVATAKGGISGGTLESMRGQLDAMRLSTALRSLAADPYALSPDRTRAPTTQQPLEFNDAAVLHQLRDDGQDAQDAQGEVL